MKVVRAVSVVEAPGIEVEQLWYDRTRWASWIDEFAHLALLEGDWPLAESRRVWNARPGGRGRVAEKVFRYEAGAGQSVMLEDERITGMLRVRFETDGVRTRITLELEADPKEKLPPGKRWWLRRKLGEGLRRTLERFGYELAAERGR